MSISFDKALGIHESALHFRSERAGVLANNLANIDTPNFKAKDLDFKQALNQQMKKGSHFDVATTNDRHIAAFTNHFWHTQWDAELGDVIR